MTTALIMLRLLLLLLLLHQLTILLVVHHWDRLGQNRACLAQNLRRLWGLYWSKGCCGWALTMNRFGFRTHYGRSVLLLLLVSYSSLTSTLLVPPSLMWVPHNGASPLVVLVDFKISQKLSSMQLSGVKLFSSGVSSVTIWWFVDICCFVVTNCWFLILLFSRMKIKRSSLYTILLILRLKKLLTWSALFRHLLPDGLNNMLKHV